jgi:predicted RNA binding protein YcfA (HicA-like mRNA interferase family)
MKRRDLVRKLEEMGCVLVRHGRSHDWYTNPTAKKLQPVPVPIGAPGRRRVRQIFALGARSVSQRAGSVHIGKEIESKATADRADQAAN